MTKNICHYSSQNWLSNAHPFSGLGRLNLSSYRNFQYSSTIHLITLLLYILLLSQFQLSYFISSMLQYPFGKLNQGFDYTGKLRQFVLCRMMYVRLSLTQVGTAKSQWCRQTRPVPITMAWKAVGSSVTTPCSLLTSAIRYIDLQLGLQPSAFSSTYSLW